MTPRAARASLKGMGGGYEGGFAIHFFFGNFGFMFGCKSAEDGGAGTGQASVGRPVNVEALDQVK